MNTRAVVFDFDGLMIDSERVMAHCVIEALRSKGAAIEMEDIGHLFGSTEADDQWVRLLRSRLGDSYRMQDLERDLDRLVPPLVSELGLLPGNAELLDAADEMGWKVGLASGRSRVSLDAHLQRLGVADRFDAIVTASEVTTGKPAADIFLEAARRLDVTPSGCVALEDSLPGALAALKAGMLAVVCPSSVSEACLFPTDVIRVHSLMDVRLEDF